MLNRQQITIIILLGISCFAVRTQAQEEAAPAAPSALVPVPAGGASSSFTPETPAAPGAAQPSAPGAPGGNASDAAPGAPGAGEPKPADGPGAASAFDFGPFAPPSAPLAPQFLPGTGADAPTSGAVGVPLALKPQAPPTTFSLPGLYGRGNQVFTAGSGRFSRPRFRWRANMSTGFDTNVFQTPKDGVAIPETVIPDGILVSEGTPATIRLEPVFITIPGRVTPVFVPPQRRQIDTRVVVVPGTPPEFEDLVIPGTPAPEITSSALARASFSMDAQAISSRSVFAMDARVNSTYFLDRPDDQIDYDGSIGFNFAYRVFPRLQFSISADIAYLSQPDFSRINTPTRQRGGEYLTYGLRPTLSYRWTPRLSSTLSTSLGGLQYVLTPDNPDNNFDISVGIDSRYQVNSRMGISAEVRSGQTTYELSPLRDSSTIFLLIGADFILGPRLRGDVKIGQSTRSFQTGESKSAPYLEAVARYVINPTSEITWRARYGFEEPPDAATTLLSLRTSLNYTTQLTRKLTATGGLDFINQTFETGTTMTTDTTYSFTANLSYQLTRYFSLSASVLVDGLTSDREGTDYTRQRFFIGADYSF